MVSKQEIYCIIMAGGIGSRFWPLSRNSKPKQFLDILGTGTTLLQQTFHRMTRICPPENIFIVTSQVYKDQVLDQLPTILEEQVLLEPMRRNTAPCVSFATYKIKQKNPNALIVVAPSDHLILNENNFIDTINSAVKFASENDALLTLGVKPSRPETGYGYIQIGKGADKKIPNLFKVKTFTEKPNHDMAKIFMDSGEFYWNSGIFVWSLPSILKAFDKHLAEVDVLFKDITGHFGTKGEKKAIEGAYAECKNISIDYGIMEKADNVYVVCSEFGWSDLGTWGSLHMYSDKDIHGNSSSSKNVKFYSTKNTHVNAPEGKLVVTQGLDNYIVVDSGDVLLICKLQDEQEIKKFVNDLKLEKGDQYI